MNRLDLAKKIIEEGKKRGIFLKAVSIYDRTEYLEFYPEVVNETKKGWIYKHQIEELIHDFAPVERPHKIGDIRLASRRFEVGDQVEIEGLWILKDFGEEDPDIIQVGSGAGLWRSGWVRGKVVETPEQNDRALVVIFERDVYIEEEKKWHGSVQAIEKAVDTGEIKKVLKGRPIYVGTGTWTVRKA